MFRYKINYIYRKCEKCNNFRLFRELFKGNKTNTDSKTEVYNVNLISAKSIVYKNVILSTKKTSKLRSIQCSYCLWSSVLTEKNIFKNKNKKNTTSSDLQIKIEDAFIIILDLKIKISTDNQIDDTLDENSETLALFIHTNKLIYTISDFVAFRIIKSMKAAKLQQQTTNTSVELRKKHVSCGLDDELDKCKKCRKINIRNKFYTRKFCSAACAKNRNDKQKLKWNQIKKYIGDIFSSDETSEIKGNSKTASVLLNGNPIQWTIEEVQEFISNIPGCSKYARNFAYQHIDGKALMLLNLDDLINLMFVRLGPALKILTQINIRKKLKNQRI